MLPVVPPRSNTLRRSTLLGIRLPPVADVPGPVDCLAVAPVLFRLVLLRAVVLTVLLLVPPVPPQLRFSPTARGAVAGPTTSTMPSADRLPAPRATPPPGQPGSLPQALNSARFEQIPTLTHLPRRLDHLPQGTAVVQGLHPTVWRRRPPLHTSPSGWIGQAPTPRPPPTGAGARFSLSTPSGMGRIGRYGSTSDSSRKVRSPCTPLTRSTTWIAFHISGRVGRLVICQPRSSPLGRCPGPSTRSVRKHLDALRACG